jgi:hypothetical protein
MFHYKTILRAVLALGFFLVIGCTVEVVVTATPDEDLSDADVTSPIVETTVITPTTIIPATKTLELQPSATTEPTRLPAPTPTTVAQTGLATNTPVRATVTPPQPTTIAAVPTMELTGKELVVNSRTKIELGRRHLANFGTFEITTATINILNRTVEVTYSTYASGNSDPSIEIELVTDNGTSDKCQFAFYVDGVANHFEGRCILNIGTLGIPWFLLIDDQNYLDLESAAVVGSVEGTVVPIETKGPETPSPTPTPRITVTPSPTPTATPVVDTSLIAMHSWRTGEDLEHQKLWLQNEIGSTPRELPVNVGVGELRVSPDRQHIVQLYQDGLEIFDKNGRRIVGYSTIKNGLKNSVFSITGVSWSSNFSVLIAGNGYDATGNETTGLWQFDIRSGATFIYFDLFDYQQSTSEIDWKFDGSVVLSLTPHSSSDSQLWILKADARTIYRISDSPKKKAYPRWSPDGQTILFSDGFSTYTMNTTGEAETLIVGGIWDAVWSPDGLYIAGTQGTKYSYSNEIRWFELSTGSQGVIAGFSTEVDWR